MITPSKQIQIQKKHGKISETVAGTCRVNGSVEIAEAERAW